MNQAAQQISPDPARDFANAILAETNGARDLIELLHEISQGNYDANQNDRISATNTLMDRGSRQVPQVHACPEPRRRARQRRRPYLRLQPVSSARQRRAKGPQRTRVPQARLPARRLPESVPRTATQHAYAQRPFPRRARPVLYARTAAPNPSTPFLSNLLSRNTY